MCLEAKSNEEMLVKVRKCHGNGGDQYFELRDGKIKRDRYLIQCDGSKISFKRHLSNESPRVCDYYVFLNII